MASRYLMGNRKLPGEYLGFREERVCRRQRPSGTPIRHRRNDPWALNRKLRFPNTWV